MGVFEDNPREESKVAQPTQTGGQVDTNQEQDGQEQETGTDQPDTTPTETDH